MPAVPPSYDQAVAGGAAGNVGGGGFYPQLPPQEKGAPPPANYAAPPPSGVPAPNAGTTTVVTQVSYRHLHLPLLTMSSPRSNMSRPRPSDTGQ